MGELGDTTTACAAGAANPMTDPGHPSAAVGPPADPDRTRPSTAWWRDAPPGAWIRPDGLPDRDPRTIARAPCSGHPRVRVGSRLGLEVDLCASGNVGGYRARPAPGWERWRWLRCCSSRSPSRWTRPRARPSWRARPSRRGAARPRPRSRSSVVYQNANGSRAEHVSVLFDSLVYEMARKPGGSWGKGVTFGWSGKLPAGRHAVVVSAVAKDNSEATLTAGTVTISAPAEATPPPTPSRRPSRRRRPPPPRPQSPPPSRPRLVSS